MVMELVISVMLLFVGIAILVIIHVCVVGRAFRRNHNNHSIGVVQRIIMNTSQGMSPEDLKRLPCFEYKEGDQKGLKNGIVDTECAVCLENFKGGEKCRMLPRCNHSFHAQCIDSWLLNSTAACPICRSRVASSLTVKEQSVSSSEVQISGLA